MAAVMATLNKLKQFAIEHPLVMFFCVSILSGMMALCIFILIFAFSVLVGILGIVTLEENMIAAFLGGVTLSTILGCFFGCFVIYPMTLIVLEILLVLDARKKAENYQKGRTVDLITIILGILYSCLVLNTFDVCFTSDWNIALYNSQLHTPVYTESVLTVIVIAIVGIVGYIIVNYIPLQKAPPLLIVSGISAMYLGTIESLIWMVQIFYSGWPLLLLPLNCVLITAKTVRYKIREWQQISYEMQKIDSVPILRICNRFLLKSERWPIVAFILMLPILGILIVILVLFGQAPNAIIQAWTQTSDWNLSQKVSPQNIYVDEHYLCTVAAGGHKSVVRPLRLGVRHGHQVIVNRQLCIANAFEQILEEKAPQFHKIVRKFYDTYGFPIAKLIRSQYIADMVYIWMKPLEWIFLLVLYFVDNHPEDRIAIQYTGKTLNDFF